MRISDWSSDVCSSDLLAHHGYKLSPGTLYPMLHAMEKKGYLVSREEQRGSVRRRFYRATDLGCEALGLARAKDSELYGELVAGYGQIGRAEGGGRVCQYG